MSTSKRPWWDWVQKHLDDHNLLAADMVKRCSFDHARVSRWREGVNASVPHSKEVAEFFGMDVREGLIAAGYLTREESGLAEGSQAAKPRRLHVADLTDEELVDELARRLASRT
ncbi:hypothetical protein SAMN05421805_12762 [Saccharopolyspora antimicrobica]|uniref:XRE family transcriptional regulator n=2 Tax=Saccharopolyspora TaxID=1835 RepID=A0A1I5KKU7_9PSEU|nr:MULTISPECIES: hypothetical protein [Saccharopolyspora]RKT85635.1 hypothetical protein ATL45_3982 [Saccharopolyspora antimicrobica]SFE69682.1 hypothetical protein SAMN05216506_113180 [Saccharopolyspora kobensis]SFO85635.1 hypothetical protein SAMN05421805_12762 [Saccharopolyspora antimicrobica]